MQRRVLLLLFLNRILMPPWLLRAIYWLVAMVLVFVSATFPLFMPSILRAQEPQPAANCVELVQNGGFEETGAGWQSVAGSSLFTYATDQFASGRHSLLLGYTAPDNIAVTYGVEQRLTLPAESSLIDFTFHYAILVEGENSPGDQAYLSFFDAATNQLLAMLVLAPSGGAWSVGRYDLTPLAGQDVRMAFASQNDGEPGKLIMRIDDVSIRACLSPEALSLQPLPTPTATPPAPEPLLLVPQPTPTSTDGSTNGSTAAPSQDLAQEPAQEPAQTTPPPENAVTEQQPFATPQANRIETLAECDCSANLYSCSDFASWAVAQACFSQCQVRAGYDIHTLDPDKNGVACELELQDVAPLDATPSPQPTPSTITETNAVTSTIAPGAPPVVDATADTIATGTATTGTVTTEIVTTTVTTGTVVTTGAVTTSTVASRGAITQAVAAASEPPVEGANTNAPVAANNAGQPVADQPVRLTAFDILRLLLSSPWGFVLLGAVVIMGGFALWGAYTLGQKGTAQRPTTVNPHSKIDAPDGFVASDGFVAEFDQEFDDDFTLQPNNKAPAPKA